MKWRVSPSMQLPSCAGNDISCRMPVNMQVQMSSITWRKKIALYFHTLRYLRPIQVWGRLVFLLQSPRPDLRPAPELRARVVAWHLPVEHEQSQFTATRFRFLNEEHEIAVAADWNSPALEKLWLYHLHYFDDMTAQGASARRAWHRQLVDRWVFENPPGSGVGWEPYPISRRVVNWVKWSLSGNELGRAGLHSLAVQLRYLTKRMEVHLLGNHLFANAKALCFGGMYFSGEEADHWHALGKKYIDAQLGEQILDDGGHFERSPMYHALMLEDMLDLVSLCDAYGRPADVHWRETIVRMIAWLAAMTHPDGEIAFFNDAATGIAPKTNELVDYARRLGLDLPREGAPNRVGLLGKSGYARIEQGSAVLLADVGPVGPDYLPGHAHADTLSFELSFAGRRVLVNSGTSVYGSGGERQRQRGTAAHNTLRLDGLDSSEVWASFRVARRARVFDVRYGNHALSAGHDGYRRLPGKPLHHREWTVDSEGVEIVDRVVGAGSHLAEIIFHIHPGWRPHLNADYSCVLSDTLGGKSMAMRLDTGMTWRIEPSTWHPQFGVSVPNYRLVGCRNGELPMRFGNRLSWPCEY